MGGSKPLLAYEESVRSRSEWLSQVVKWAEKRLSVRA
jgi:hypothetical protein